MEHILLFLFTAAFFLPSICAAAARPPQSAESRIIDECLQSFGGLNEETSRRLLRFKEWSENYEEIPCFSKCYLNRMFDAFDEISGFKREQVIEQFGQALHKACQHRMVSLPNKCEEAYHGFHCLVNREDDPFVIIESMQNVSTHGKKAMRDCLSHFDQYEWERMKDYRKNPVREPIPCFTKCFIEKLHVYDANKQQWNLPELTKHLGVSKMGANIRHCLPRKRNRNTCVWIYQEFTCFKLASL